MRARFDTVTLLPSHVRAGIVGDLEKIGKLSSSLSALGKVQRSVQLLADGSPCEECEDLLREVVDIFPMGEFGSAIEELGRYIAVIATRVEESIYESKVLTGDALRDVEGIVVNQV